MTLFLRRVRYLTKTLYVSRVSLSLALTAVSLYMALLTTYYFSADITYYCSVFSWSRMIYLGAPWHFLAPGVTSKTGNQKVAGNVFILG